MLAAMMMASMLAGCGNSGSGNASGSTAQGSKVSETAKSEASEDSEASEEEGTDQSALAELTFGKGWKIDMSKDYSGSQYKRFDGLEFTRIVNTGGYDLPEGMTMDDNDRVWMFELKSGMIPKTLWSANGDAFNQKRNAAIASGEIPDLMEVDVNQYYTLVKSDLIADLTEELVDGNHPGIQAFYEAGDNLALETLKVNGRIYGIPQVSGNFDGSPIIWIRKDWMEKLNLEEPKTYADLEDIALAFMAADLDGNGKDDTYGIPVLPNFDASYGGSGNMCDLFLNVGGAALGLWQKQDDGTVIYGSLMDGAKDALNLLNDWYAKGIIPSDFATWNGDTLKQIIGEDKAGIVFSPWWGCWDAMGANISLNQEAEWSAYVLPGEEGAQVRSAAGNPVRSIYVVRKGFEHPEAFVYAYDMIAKGYDIDKEASGFDGTTFETNNNFSPMNGSSTPSLFTKPMDEVIPKCLNHEFASVEEMRSWIQEKTDGLNDGASDSYTLAFTYGPLVNDAIKEGKSPREVTLGDTDAVTVYDNYLACTVGTLALANANPTPVSTAFQGTTDSMNKYSSFLNNLVSDAYIKMIMGDTDGKSVDEYFDGFVEEYLSKGGAEITAEVQEIIGE